MGNIKTSKKVLFVATVDSHIINFHMPYLKLFKEKGYEVHVCTGEKGKIPYCDKKYNISIRRNPYKMDNIIAIKQLKKIITENHYEIIHCHTPMGGVVTRLAAKKARKNGTRVIYTAHGFHFYKGAPLLNWLIYYPIEKWLSRYTDCLITINTEDYELAKKKFRKCKQIELVHGVGLDTTKFDVKISNQAIETLKDEIGIKKDDIVLTYIAELNKNKNQQLLIKTIEQIVKEGDTRYILLLVGDGELKEQYQEYVKKHKLENNIKLLGKRKDIAKILKITDIYVATSLREGLPVNILEALYMGLPIIATDNRGHRELIENEENGYIIQNNSTKLKEKLIKVCGNKGDFKADISCYLLENVKERMKKVYKEVSQKKIIHILNSNSYSGAENVVITLINGMKQLEEYKCYYASPEGPIKNILDKEKIKFIPMTKVTTKEIRKIIKKYHPDLIQAHDFRASIMTALFYNKCKIISQIHQTPKFLNNWNLKSIIYYITIKKYNRIIGVSSSIIEECIFKDKLQGKYCTINNVIDSCKILKLANENRCEYNKKYDLLFFGRLNEVKNPEKFIDIVKTFSIIHPDTRAVIIGDGNLAESCREKIKTLELQENIDMLGYIKDPFPIIKNCKIMIITSKWEGIPMAVLECMTLGIPVIHNGVGGLNRLLEKMNLDECETIEEYSKTIDKVQKNWRQYSNKAKKISIENSNINEWIGEYKSIYQQLYEK